MTTESFEQGSTIAETKARLRTRIRTLEAENKKLRKEQHNLRWLWLAAFLTSPIGLHWGLLYALLAFVAWASFWCMGYYITVMHIYQRAEEIKLTREEIASLGAAPVEP